MLVTIFSPRRPKFIDKRIKGVIVYICNIIKNTKQNEITFENKMKILFWLFPAKAKTDSRTKIVILLI